MADVMDRDILDDIQDLEILAYLKRRQRLVCPDRGNDLDDMDDYDFETRYRLDKNTFESLLRMLDDTLSSSSEKNQALSPFQKMCIAIRYFATGSHQLTVGDIGKASQPSVSRAIKEVAEAIAAMRPNYIRMAQSEYERQQVSHEFNELCGFPGVIGALDCSLIPIRSPGGDAAETFRSRKSWFALNVQTVSDASLYIRDIVACWPGSTHDSTIFDNSYLRAVMETQVPDQYHLLGDNGYGCRSYLLTPILNATTIQQQRYNTAHKRGRNVVERQYGLWKRRFSCIGTKFACKLDTTMAVIVATAVLHNIALEMNDTAELPVIDETNPDDDDPGNRIVGANHVAGIAKRNSLLSTVFN